MMMFSGLFLDLGLSETLNLGLCFCTRENCTFIFLLLESFASFRPVINEATVISVVLFFSFLLSVWVVQFLTDSIVIRCLLSRFLFQMIFFVLEIILLFFVSHLFVVLSIQKSMRSSFIGGTCFFVCLLFSFDGKVVFGFLGVLSQVYSFG